MGKVTGTGVVTTADFKDVRWVGKTASGAAVTIELSDAINMGNIDWTFAEKDDTVAQVVFTATYTNTDSASDTAAEPWSVDFGNVSAGASEIMLGAGKFYIGSKMIGLTRGGGQFTVEREFRSIAADGDRGSVKGRVVMDASNATLTLNALTILTSIKDLYPAIADAQE